MKEKNNIALACLKALLNPISPITIIIIGLLLNLMLDENLSPEWLQNLLKILTPEVLTTILISWLILTFIYTSKIHNENLYKEKIKKLQYQIAEKDRQIENNSALFYNKYGELAKYNKIQKLNSLLISFVDNNTIVQSAHIYEFRKKVLKKSYQKQVIDLKINFLLGYAYEGVEVNGLLQSYYTFPKKTFEQILEIINISKKLSLFDDTDYLYKLLEEKSEKVIQFIIKILRKIKNENDCKDYHAALYRALLIIIDIIYTDYNSGRVVTRVLENSEIENTLLTRKRTGILGSILLNRTYIFKHVGSSSKNGRMYVCFPFELQNQNYILLLTLPPNQLDSKQLSSTYESLENDFETRLSSHFSKI